LQHYVITRSCIASLLWRVLRNFLLSLIAEPIKRDDTEAKNEGAPSAVPQKPKLSKAERRAIQEAQRAAKAAAKEAGSYHVFIITVKQTEHVQK
jgi:hypothetical protein